MPISLLALGLALLPAPAQADELADLLARARAYVGPEAALATLESIHLTGTLRVSDDNTAAIDVLFAQPFRHRVEVRIPSRIEVTALDGYEGWQRVQNTAKPDDWRLNLLPPAQVRRLRALTWESLAFYRSLDEVRGRVEDLGPVTVDGIACRQVKFWHADGIHFIRSFEIATGRLVQTETADGARVREEGEVLVGGLRFPARQTTTTRSKDATGQPIERTVVITFDQIRINEPVDAAIFAVPALSRR